MKIIEKPIYVTKSFMPPMEEYFEEISILWGNHVLTNMGTLHETFKKGLLDYLEVDYCTLTNNGHLALEISMGGGALYKNQEIITTPFTFASTTHAIVNQGFKPVFCDIELGTFNIDVNKIESLITSDTYAIMPVHVFGNPCDVYKIEEIAKKHNLLIIYDAAHAFGVKVNGTSIGNFGDISMFSLHATKVFHSIEGGVLSYKNGDLASKFRLAKNFGIAGAESVVSSGTNSKMNEFQAAMGIVNLRYIDTEIAKRKKITETYRELLKDIEGIRYLTDMLGVSHNYAYFPILIDTNTFGMSRDELFERLKQYNIFTRKYFYPLTTNFDCYKESFKEYSLPIANVVANNVLTLPIYGGLSLGEVSYIVAAIEEIKKAL